MPISEYSQIILDQRNIPLTKSREVIEKLDEALRLAHVRLQMLIDQSTGSRGKVQRLQWERRQIRLARVMNELALELKADMITATSETVNEISSGQQAAANALLSEVESTIAVDFTAVPQETLTLLAQRQDVEGFKFSANVWADNQTARINRDVLAGIARGESARDLSVRLRGFVLGSDIFTGAELLDLRRIRGLAMRKLGTSIKAKAIRLARTEIATAAWEASRRSADMSPLVKGIRWRLSATHPKWDVCDILASQDLYGLGRGVYPPQHVPTRPHPNDMCFQVHVLRKPEEWETEKPEVPIIGNPDEIVIRKSGVTDNYLRTQRQLAVDHIKAAA